MKLPNWEIGPVARGRLAEMAKGRRSHRGPTLPASVDQVISCDGHKVCVRVYFEQGDPYEPLLELFVIDNTIGLAVAGVYKDWKASE